MPNPTRAESIKKLLDAMTQPDLAALYHRGMEVQINVAKDEGIRSEGYKSAGKAGISYTDGAQTWFAFRIPKNSWGEPEDNSDIEMKYDLFAHADGIGMTGWCFTERRSKFSGFDFDALVGHSEKHKKVLDDSELARVREAACGIPWVEVRRSTSGNGIHLYVRYADAGIPTANHTEHAALSMAVLSEMSALVGYDFRAKVDAAGGNMWHWHRKMPKGPSGTQKDGVGLQLVKAATATFPDAPKGWRSFLKQAKGERKKSLPDQVGDQEQSFEETSGQQPRVQLDAEHKKLIDWLHENKGWGWYDAGRQMLVTHTTHLKRAHDALEMRGSFETASPASNPEEQNCWAHPMRGGAWVVRRFTKGTGEHASWATDGKGWTRCYLNRDPDLRTAAASKGGVETAEGAFQFSVLDDVEDVVELLGGQLEIPNIVASRPARVFPHKDRTRIVIEVDKFGQDSPDEMLGWYDDKGKRWRTVVSADPKLGISEEVGTLDDLVRHTVTEGGIDGGWYVKVEDRWHFEPKSHVGLALTSLGKKKLEVEQLLGANILQPWQVVERPFEEEYPGDRTWNRSKVRFVYPKSDDVGEFPTWRAVFEHSFRGLDEALASNGWALANDVKHGWEYGEFWYASILQNPYAPLPYLFFWSPEEDTGKSIIHEAAKLIITEEGIVEANKVIEGKDVFNGQLESAVLCYIEELDLNKNKGAYERIKNLVTSPRISIRKLYMDAYQASNKTHWIHCANKWQACPIFPGDTRITMIRVAPLPPGMMIPKTAPGGLMDRLKKEAPHFFNHLLRLEIPASGSRLSLPVVDTSEKHVVAAGTRDALQAFMSDTCHSVDGESIVFSEFCDKFREQLDAEEVGNWGRGKISQGIPPEFPVGKRGADTHIGNISWKAMSSVRPKLVLRGRALVPVGG